MANPTTNFGWVMPTSTDLVTDLPADFAVFGQGVDTSFQYLKGGTTGQVLSKTSNTDLAFTWVSANPGDITAVNTTAPLQGGATSGAVTLTVDTATTSTTGVVQLSDSTSTTSSVLAATPTAVKSAYDLANSAIAKSTATTKGDLLAATAASTVTRLGVGTNGQVLTAASGQATGLQWSTPATGALTKISTTTLSSSFADISNIFSATYDRYLIVMEITAGADSIMFQMQNSGTRATSDYGGAVSGYRYNATSHVFSKTASGDGYLLQLGSSTSPGTNGMVQAIITNPFAAAVTRINGTFNGVWNAGSFWTAGSFGMTHNVATSYNGISILPVSGNMTGTFTVYGMS